MNGPQTGAPRCKKILIVEDDDAIRELMKITLELAGYTVQSARNGKEGVEMLSGIPRPCLILLDLMMPVMDGWGFVDAVSSNPGLADIPVVVVTAFSDDQRPIRTRQMLKKPLEVEDLYKVARQYCGS